MSHGGSMSMSVSQDSDLLSAADACAGGDDAPNSRSRWRVSVHETNVLEAVFASSPRPNKNTIHQLATMLSVKPRQVQIWVTHHVWGCNRAWPSHCCCSAQPANRRARGSDAECRRELTHARLRIVVEAWAAQQVGAERVRARRSLVHAHTLARSSVIAISSRTPIPRALRRHQRQMRTRPTFVSDHSCGASRSRHDCISSKVAPQCYADRRAECCVLVRR